MQNSSTLPSSLKYSIQWAQGVVDALKAKHTRALAIVLEAYGLSEHNLAVYLASCDPLFNYLRERVKKVALCASRTGSYVNSEQFLDWEQCKGIVKSFPLLAERLDKGRKTAHTRKAGLKSEPGSSVSEIPAQPLAPDVDAQGRCWKQGVLCL